MDRPGRLAIAYLTLGLLWIPATRVRGDEFVYAQLRTGQPGVQVLEVAHPSSESFHPESPALDGSGSTGGQQKEYHDRDWIEEYQHNHDTLDGFPRIHLLRTEHAWLDPHWQLKYTGAIGRNSGTVDDHQFEFEYFHVFNNRLAAVVNVPYSFLNPDVGPSRNGFGDMSFGVQWLAFNGYCSQLSAGLGINVPTGDADRGLGEGAASLEPSLLWYHDLGQGNGLQAQFAIKSPLAVRNPENEFSYNIGYSHTCAGMKDSRMFHWLSPLIELNGSTLLNGANYGQTVIDLTPGVRWFVGEENQMGVGVSFPISGEKDERYETIVSYIAHF